MMQRIITILMVIIIASEIRDFIVLDGRSLKNYVERQYTDWLVRKARKEINSTSPEQIANSFATDNSLTRGRRKQPFWRYNNTNRTYTTP